MSEVYYLSDIGAEATDLVQRYMTKFFPDAKEEMLAPKGIISTCRRKLPDASCVFAVVDKDISAIIEEKGMKEVFDLKNVYRYEDFDSLKDVMIQEFGMDLSDKAKSTVPPDAFGSQSLDSFFANYGNTEIEPMESPIKESPIEPVVTDEKVSEEKVSVEEKVSEEKVSEEKVPVEEVSVKEVSTKDVSVKEISTKDITIESKEETHIEPIVEVEPKPIEEEVPTEEPDVTESSIEKSTLEESSIEKSTLEESTTKEPIVEEVHTEPIVEETNIESNTETDSIDVDIDFGTTLETSNTSDVKVINEDAESLKDKLIQAQMTISSLSAQLEEIQDSNDEVLMTRIEVLTRKLETKENEVKTLRQISATTTENVDVLELNDLRDELIRVKEEKANIEFDKKKIENELNLSESRIKELQSSSITYEEKIKALNRQIQSNDAKIERLQGESTDKDAVISDKKAEVDVLNQELISANNRVSELTTQLNNTKTELSSMKLERDNLTADLAKINSDLAQANATIEEKVTAINELQTQLEDTKNRADALTSTLTDVRNEVQTLTEQLNTVKEEKEKLAKDVEDKDKTIERVNTEMSELKTRHENEISVLNGTVETLSNKASKAKDFKEELTALNEQVSNLNGQISDLNTELSNKNSLLDAKNSELSIKETELKGYRDREDVIKEQLNSKDRAYDELLNAKDLMEKDFTSRLTSSNEIIEQLREKIKGKESELTDLTATNSKLTNEISSLSETLDANKPDITASANLEEELFDAKKTIARLQNEADELRSNNIDKNALQEANARVQELETEIATMQDDRIKERNESENELSELKLKYADLEVKLATQNKEPSGVYAKMKQYSTMKGPYQIDLQELETLQLRNNFICVASGSTESNSSVYHLLRRTCMKNTKTKFLIVDLVTETSIDRDFGIKKIEFPKEWLDGTSNCKKYVAKTTYDNTCVISTGFSYLNDLFLLDCDLGKKLQELDTLGVTVILNVGCLNNLVSKVLFNSLSSIMKTYVIVKATPINLRTVILSMAGLTVSKNVEVECVDYDEKASKPVYLKLAQKFSAKILQGDDVLVV